MALPTYIDNRLSPHTIIECKLGNSWIPLDCIIDTGFIGYLILPIAMKKYFTTSPLTTQNYIIGSGEIITFPVYEGNYKLNNSIQTIDVIFSKILTPLLGIKFLSSMQLILDYKNLYIPLHN